VDSLATFAPLAKALRRAFLKPVKAKVKVTSHDWTVDLDERVKFCVFPCASRLQAEELLRNQPPGSFVVGVRTVDAATPSRYTKLVVSHVQATMAIAHSKVTFDATRKIFTRHGDGKSFSSLAAHLEDIGLLSTDADAIYGAVAVPDHYFLNADAFKAGLSRVPNYALLSDAQSKPNYDVPVAVAVAAPLYDVLSQAEREPHYAVPISAIVAEPLYDEISSISDEE
jgi:hypothetical protein